VALARASRARRARGPPVGRARRARAAGVGGRSDPRAVRGVRGGRPLASQARSPRQLHPPGVGLAGQRDARSGRKRAGLGAAAAIRTRRALAVSRVGELYQEQHLDLRRRAPRGALEPCGGERTPRRACRSRLVQAGGSLPRRGGRTWAASSPDNDGTGQHCQMVWVRQARREGVREKPAAERFSRASTSSNLADLGWAAARIRASARRTPGPVSVVGREATEKVCGVPVARLQGHSWSPNPTSGSRVNVGTISAAPSPASMTLTGGKARRRLMPPGWDGGLVVVAGVTTGHGGRESRLQGEGVQQVRSRHAARGGRW